MKNKILTIFFALLASTNLWAQNSGTCGANLTWSLENGVLTITGTGEMYDYYFYYPNLAPWGRTSITTVIIDNGVTSIGNYAFYECSDLTSLTIGNNVTSIGRGAFYYCSGLISIVVESGNSIYDSHNNSNAIIETATNTLLVGCQNTIIPNNVTSIGSLAFYGCSGLTSVTIPDNVTKIESGAFSGCSNLTSVVWNARNCSDFSSSTSSSPYMISSHPFGDIKEQITSFIFGDSVQYVSAYLCSNMSSLDSITIPNSVTSIGSGAFEGCSGLTSITIGNSVTSIGSSSFEDCSGLTSVIWNTRHCSNFSGPSNPFNENITSFIIGDSVQYIPAYLCTNMSNLTSITIPSTVTSIGNNAFSGCSGLTSVTIPNSVLSVGNKAFFGCFGLTSISIGTNVTSIGEGAFDECSELTSVVWNAKNCDSTPFSSIANNIKTFSFGDDVEQIPSSLCSGMTQLDSISLGTNIRTIGDNAFYNCYSLKSIRNYRPTPSNVGDNTFGEVDKFACVLYIPTGSTPMYRFATGWKDFFDIREFSEESAIEHLSEDVSVAELLANSATQIFTLQGNDVTALRSHLPADTYILRLGNKAVKVYIK